MSPFLSTQQRSANYYSAQDNQQKVTRKLLPLTKQNVISNKQSALCVYGTEAEKMSLAKFAFPVKAALWYGGQREKNIA